MEYRGYDSAGVCTVEGGELTTNLKLRRTVVTERLGDVIASLYDPAPAAAGRSRR